MDFLVGFAALALVLPLALFSIGPLASAWRRRHEVKRFYGRLADLDRKPAKPKVVIPASGETAAAITRFRRAVLHSDLADYFRPD
jgi:hypothetical protein